MCDNNQDTPFCLPQDGAQVQTGETVNIIWNPSFFTTPSSGSPSQIFIQADFPSSSSSSLTGFTSTALDPRTGSFAWAILASYLPSSPLVSNTTTAQLSIAAPLSQTPQNGSFARIGDGTLRFPGPTVHILRGSNSSTSKTALGSTPNPQQQQQTGGGGGGGPNPLAIALPVAFGVLTALAMVAYAVLARHRPGWVAGVRRRVMFWDRRAGERVRLRGRDVEIKVVKTDLEGLRANAGRMFGNNVFREEVGRQEMERGRF